MLLSSKRLQGFPDAQTAHWRYIKHRSWLFVLLIPQPFPQKAKIDRLSTQCAILLSVPWYHVAENGLLPWYGCDALDQTLKVSVCLRSRLQRMDITTLGHFSSSCTNYLPLIPNTTLCRSMVELALPHLFLEDRRAVTTSSCLGKAHRGSIKHGNWSLSLLVYRSLSSLPKPS
jgi:hypothetical protein